MHCRCVHCRARIIVHLVDVTTHAMQKDDIIHENKMCAIRDDLQIVRESLFRSNPVETFLNILFKNQRIQRHNFQQKLQFQKPIKIQT